MSLERHKDTVVAPITAPGGAVAVVRLSGPRAYEMAGAVFEPWPAKPESHRAAYGRFSHGDDGLVLPFDEGKSYTGEESVELSVHGSHASVSALVENCIAAGARMAEPGEFTLRAFMNGRLDLTQAEGVRDSVAAKTEAQLRQANLLREGALRDQVRAIRNEVVGILAMVEAATDFSEETGPLDRKVAIARCIAVRRSLGDLIETASASRIVREGATVAIVGLPNSGKSSLLNAVLGADRAIVTEVPGTTRDTVEESVAYNGMLLRLIDTAGLRESTDPVERLGVERTREAIESADAVWYVYDASLGWASDDEKSASALHRPAIVVANKSDIGTGDRGIAVSALRRENVGSLLVATEQIVGTGDGLASLVNARHAPLLKDALCAIERTMETLVSPVPDDLAAVDLQAAIRPLGEITGESAAPDIIERVFKDFCIGK